MVWSTTGTAGKCLKLRTEATMQVQVAETGPCSRTLTIQVPVNLVREHIDRMYDSANQQVRLKGFRPGKVPRKMLEKQFGADILREAKEQLIQRFFGEACRTKEISPIGRITVDDFEKLEIKVDTALEFTVKVDIRPKVEIGNSKGLKIQPYTTEVTDQEVSSALTEIANQKRTMTQVDDPAQKGDFVKVDLRFVDETGAQVHERKGVKLNTTIPIAGVEPAAFEAALVGAAPGKPIEIAMTFPANFEKDAFRGKAGKAMLDVLEVHRVSAPPIDDALAKTLDFENLDALRADLRTRIGHEKERVGKLQQEDQCLQQLIEAHRFDLPVSLVDEQQIASLNAFGNRLQQAGMSKEEIPAKLEASKDEARQDAERRVRLFFVIEGVARQQKLFVTENDAEAEIRNIAAANAATPEQVKEHLEKNNQLGELRLALLERKVRDFLRENAQVVDRKGN